MGVTRIQTESPSLNFICGSANLPLHKGKGLIFSMCFTYYTYLMCFFIEALEKKTEYFCHPVLGDRQ